MFIEKRQSLFLIPIAIVAILFVFQKGINNPWNKPIAAEGIGYYSYLPALFIYHDRTFSFLDKTGPLYYADGRGTSKECLNHFDGISVDKYFIGSSVLMLPFFFIAHLSCFVFDFPPDGYSTPYQLLMVISAWFYLFVGCVLLEKILSVFSTHWKQNYFIIFVLVVGTNISYLATQEPTQTHIYLFALVNLFIFSALSFFKKTELHEWKKYYFLMVFSISLIAIIRPQDVLITMLLPFCAGETNVFVGKIKKLFAHPALLCKGIVLWAVIISLPLLGWYIQTNRFFLNPYEGEHYYWNNPHLAKQLISYQKGWLLYTPLAAFSFLGFLQLYRTSKLWFYNILIFLSGIAYVFSSWWCWHYTSSFSQRVYVDFYGVIAILILFLLKGVQSHTIYKYTILFIMCFFVLLNQVQSYQCVNGILPGLNTSAGTYWKNFLSLHKSASYDFPDGSIVWSKSHFTDMENIPANNGWQGGVFTKDEFYSSTTSCYVNTDNPYSVTLKTLIPKHDITQSFHIKMEAFIKSSTAIEGAVLVFEIHRDKKMLLYKSVELKNRIRAHKWEYAAWGMKLPADVEPTDSVTAYLWIGSSKEIIYIDDITLSFLSVTNEEDNLKM
jgi:hypothetical protein